MAATRNLGSFYWTTIRYPYKPKELWESAHTQEIDGKFRYGSGIALRLPLSTFALVLGKWGPAKSESQALTDAIGGRILGDTEYDWDMIRNQYVE